MHSCKARDLTMAHIACTFYSNSTKGVEVAFVSQCHKDTKLFPHLVGFCVFMANKITPYDNFTLISP
jgi:hypothetical protein